MNYPHDIFCSLRKEAHYLAKLIKEGDLTSLRLFFQNTKLKAFPSSKKLRFNQVYELLAQKYGFGNWRTMSRHYQNTLELIAKEYSIWESKRREVKFQQYDAEIKRLLTQKEKLAELGRKNRYSQDEAINYLHSSLKTSVWPRHNCSNLNLSNLCLGMHGDFGSKNTPLRGYLGYGDFSNTNFSQALLYYIGFDMALCHGANFSHAKFCWPEVSYEEMVRREESGLYNFTPRNFWLADMSMANLSYTRLPGTYMRDATFFNANLSYADLTMVVAGGVNFVRANMENTILVNAELHCADFYGADLRGANLRGARDADLTHAMIDSTTILPDGSKG